MKPVFIHGPPWPNLEPRRAERQAAADARKARIVARREYGERKRAGRRAARAGLKASS